MTESWFESVRSLCKSCESFEVKVIDLKTDNEQFTRLITEFEAQTKNLREVNATLKSELSIKNEHLKMKTIFLEDTLPGILPETLIASI